MSLIMNDKNGKTYNCFCLIAVSGTMIAMTFCWCSRHILKYKKSGQFKIGKSDEGRKLRAILSSNTCLFLIAEESRGTQRPKKHYFYLNDSIWKPKRSHKISNSLSNSWTVPSYTRMVWYVVAIRGIKADRLAWDSDSERSNRSCSEYQVVDTASVNHGPWMLPRNSHYKVPKVRSRHLFWTSS